MSEVKRAQITFSPEGILEVTTGLDEDVRYYREPEVNEAILKNRHEQIEILSEQPGIETELEGDVAKIRVEIEKRFKQCFDPYGDDEISVFLGQVRQIVPTYPRDLIDRVFGLEFISGRGSTGNIYEHFQRWIDKMTITEDIGRQCVRAMAIPFGSEHKTRAMKKFSYRSGSDFTQISADYHFNLNVHRDKFGIIKSEQTDDSVIETHGKVDWGWVNLSTLGECACWGVPGDERERVRLRPGTKILYNMEPHNVDYARQALSQILGMGTLAFHAAMYKGDEDILANAEWEEPNVYPRRTS
jgi:hypothetical protein